MNLDESLERAYSDSVRASGVETEDVDIDYKQIRVMMHHDAEFFIEFFLHGQLDMPVPEFHKEIWRLMTDQEKERVLLAIPRDHAKTTLAKLGVIWYWLHTPHRFCVYVSNTNPIAKGACKDIVGFLDSQNFIAVYGQVEWIKQSENESLWMFDLVKPDGSKKRCILRAVGQGQQMRGINIDNQRPDIAVIDDVEDNDNTESEFQQKKLDRWVFGPFIKALARRKKILWLGNMLSKTCLLARLSRNPKWNPVIFGSLIRDAVTGILEPLWPGKWTVQALKDDFEEYRQLGLIESWMCEMMNMPGHGENGFTADQANYMPVPTPDGILAAWITVDPAFGKRAQNDETAIAVHVIPKDGSIPMTVCVDHGRFDETEMFDRVMALAMYWGAWVWGIEANAAQKVLLSFFGLLLDTRQMRHQVEMIPLLAGNGDPKVSRIRAFVSLMSRKEWAIPIGDIDITTQLVNYDVRKTEQEDDIIDSCAYGPTMMENYSMLIMAMASGLDVLGESIAQHGMEVASV